MTDKPSAFEFNFMGYSFIPKIIPTLIFIILFPALIFLGLWQLDRADEKRTIDQGVTEAIAKPALILNDADINDLETEIYRTTTIKGRFDNSQQFLLDNRTYKGKPGYHVVSSFIFKHSSKDGVSDKAILVNRGWITYQGTRDKISSIDIENNIRIISGTLKNIPRSIVLQNQEVDNSLSSIVFKVRNTKVDGISLIQSIDVNRLEGTLNYDLLPYMIELDASAENGFVREWQPYFGSIDKHNAYALQWFVMAAILLFLFFKLNIRKR